MKFNFLGGVCGVAQSNGDIDAKVTHGFRTDWVKRRQASVVLCHQRVSMKLRGGGEIMLFRIIVRPVPLYGSECWAVHKSQEQNMQVA